MHGSTHNSIAPGRTFIPLLRVLSAVCVLTFVSNRAVSAEGPDNAAASAQAVGAVNTDAHAGKYGELIDRVVAVVNNQVILQSDVDLELRMFRLLPLGDAADSGAPKALQRLITRTLIEQQIVQEDPQGLEIDPKELDSSLDDLRQSLPDCEVRDCATAIGWNRYLGEFGITSERLRIYWGGRMAILRFIEQRFRSGIRITPEQIQHYYLANLLPRYAKPADAPTLEHIAPRIQEILLEQQVNTLLDDWLKSLQSQGQVEILDPSLESSQINPVPSSAEPSQANGGSF